VVLVLVRCLLIAAVMKSQTAADSEADAIFTVYK
jgi:hypothetical protein